MKGVLFYLVICLVDMFYIGGAAYLIVAHGWSPAVLALGIILAIVSDPTQRTRELVENS